MVKKAFIKTIEILLVIVVTTMFLLIMVPRQANRPEDIKGSYLIHLERNEDFREFVQGNKGCYNETNAQVRQMIAAYLEQDFDYVFCSGTIPNQLPIGDIRVDTLMIAGDVESLDYRTTYLYYWPKT